MDDPATEDRYIEVPHDALEPETLDRLLADVALRDDTDYGDAPVPLAERVARAREALLRGELVVVYDRHSETASVVTVEALRALPGLA